MSRARDVADIQDNLGGAVPPFVAGKNAVINGGFDFFQRSSFSSTANGYSLDRWFITATGSASATVVTQQTTGVPTGSRYCMRIAMGASGGYGNPSHYIETAVASQFWGKQAVFTCKVRRNNSFTGSVNVGLEKSVTVDAGAGSTWVGVASGTVLNANLPTGTSSSDWFTISITSTVPNDGTANSLRINFGQSQVEAAGAYWEIAQAQLELGSVATPFARTGGTIQGELAACQRYYWRATAVDNYAFIPGTGLAKSTTAAEITAPNPVAMRVAPISVEYSNVNVSDGVTLASGGTITLSQATPIAAHFVITYGSGLTQFRTYFMQGAIAPSYLAFGAEL